MINRGDRSNCPSQGVGRVCLDPWQGLRGSNKRIGLRLRQGYDVTQIKREKRSQPRRRKQDREKRSVTPGQALQTVVSSLGHIGCMPLNSRGEAPGVGLQASQPRGLQILITLFPSPPRCPTWAPPKSEGCQVIAPHWQRMEVFKKRKKKSPKSSQAAPWSHRARHSKWLPSAQLHPPAAWH